MRASGSPLKRGIAFAWACLVLLSLALTGCVRTQVVSTRPEAGAQVKEIRAKRFDQHFAELELVVEVENPGDDVRLYAADFELTASGEPFAVGRTGLYGEVKGGAVTTVVIPVHLAYRDLPPVARNRTRDGKPVRIVARGTMQAVGGSVTTIPFDGEGRVTLTTP